MPDTVDPLHRDTAVVWVTGIRLNILFTLIIWQVVTMVIVLQLIQPVKSILLTFFCIYNWISQLFME